MALTAVAGTLDGPLLQRSTGARVVPTLPGGLEPDLLRSFVLIAERGSFTLAGQHLGRTQSAMSRQVQRLEGLLGQQLLTRGRDQVAPTPHGAWLLARVRPLLALHDDILGAFRAPALAGNVRLGIPEDYALGWLPRVLANFAAICPDIAVEVVAAPCGTLAGQVRDGALDLAVACADDAAGLSTGRLLRHDPLVWIGSARHVTQTRTPLPLVVAQAGCRWRQAAVAALDAACVPWRLAGTTLSQAGSMALVQAGLAVTVGLPLGLPAGLRVLGAAEGLPALPQFGIALIPGDDMPLARALGRHIEEEFRLDAGAGVGGAGPDDMGP